VLQGEDGPARRIVLANAAAALRAAEKVATLPQGVAVAAQAIDNGRALGVLNDLVALSQR
jgi:anthranilate phosphoribosyltransferase